MTSTDPTRLTAITALALWRQAAKLEVGLRVPCKVEDLDKIKATMYAARKAVIEEEPELGTLILAIKPGGDEFWLVKKTVEAP